MEDIELDAAEVVDPQPRRRRPGRRSVAIGTAAALTFAGFGAKAMVGQAATAAESTTDQARTTTAVSLRSLESSEEITGTVQLGDVVSVASSTGGTVLELVELGAELEPGDVIARVVSEASDEVVSSARQKITSAQASLAQANEGLAELTSGADRGELAGLESSLLQAERNLSSLFEPSTQASIDSAQGRLLLAELALLALEDGPTELALLQAEARMLRAQDALDDLEVGATKAELNSAEASVLQARERLEEMQETPTDAQIASADARVTSAQSKYSDVSNDRDEAIAAANANLETATSARDDAQASLDQAATASAAAQQDYCASVTHDVEAACGSLPLASTVRGELQAEIDQKTAADATDPDVALAQNLLDADADHTSASAVHGDAVQALADAQAALTEASDRTAVDQAYADVLSAKEARQQLDEGASSGDLAAARAQIDQAEATLARLKEGPSRSELVTAQADVLAATEDYDDLVAGPTAADLLLARADVANAQLTADALVEGPDETDVEIARRTVETANARLDDVLGGATAAQLAQQRAQVSSAALNLELAGSELSGLLEGGRTTVLMTGDVPAYRTMSNGDVGEDIFQLESNLELLGYSPGAVDGSFDASTASAVRAWQSSLDVNPTGEVPLGAVTFAAGQVSVSALGAGIAVGATVGSGTTLLEIVPVTRVDDAGNEVPTQRVVAALDVDDRSLVAVGDLVEIDLPDNTSVGGTVTDVRLVAETNNQGATTTSIEVEVRPDEPIDELWTDASVTVTIVTAVAEEELAVPVTALLALAEGGYALEVLADDGTFRLLAVEIGQFADGWVQIRGDGLVEGLEVATAQ